MCCGQRSRRRAGYGRCCSAYKSLARVERAFRSVKTIGPRSPAPSTIAWPGACTPMCSCACSPIISSRTCAKPWRRCSSTITKAECPEGPLLACGACQGLRRSQSQGRLAQNRRWPPRSQLRTCSRTSPLLPAIPYASAMLRPPLCANPTLIQQEVFDKLEVPLVL